MQTRQYPDKDGLRIWLSRSERSELLESVEERPSRALAFSLGLHGLRGEELLRVASEDVRELDGDVYLLEVADGKSGSREAPLSPELARQIKSMKNIKGLRKDESLLDVETRTLRNWIRTAREELVQEGTLQEDAVELTMHDLRRSWATDSYYSLAFAGVPISEQLTMSWGGWTQTSTGRETFREHYLGPVPDWLVQKVSGKLELPA